MPSAAKLGDRVTATDIHIILVPSPSGSVPTPLPHPFVGTLQQGLSTNVNINGQPAATVGSVAMNQPPHVPQGGPFQIPPRNQGSITAGSAKVFINGKPAARAGDPAMTCTDVPAPPGTVVSTTVNVIFA
jgi:uncharacterized Zn-binding protein involved in type VI secretion